MRRSKYLIYGWDCGTVLGTPFGRDTRCWVVRDAAGHNNLYIFSQASAKERLALGTRLVVNAIPAQGILPTINFTLDLGSYYVNHVNGMWFYAVMTKLSLASSAHHAVRHQCAQDYPLPDGASQ